MYLVLLSPLLLLAACAQMQPRPGSPWYPPPVGTVLEVREPLPIPIGRTRLFFQQGHRRDRYDPYRPVCAFEVRRIDRQAVRRLPPGRFRVRRVEPVAAEVVRAAPLRLAGLGPAGTGDSGRPMIQRGWHLWFEPSGTRPEPLRLSCYGALDTADRALPPSLPEMGIALGPGFHLQLAAVKGP